MRIRSFPIRVRLAAICAGLTFLILLVFAAVLGNLVGERIRGDFRDDLRASASVLASASEVGTDPALGTVARTPNLQDFAMADDAVIQITDARGRSLVTFGGPDLGPPGSDVANAGPLSIATSPIISNGTQTGFALYARPSASVEATVDRVQLFLAAGVLGGTLLAALAGLAVADRAMRPIAALTSLARDIAATRDPSRRMPVTDADDEVGELARTMDEMLEALDQARGERENALERQREFVADASHELRTPLTSVQANLELLGDDPGHSRDDREALDSALASTRRMGRLVGDLSLLARADSGRAGPTRKVDLADIARDALAEVEPIAGARRIDSRIAGRMIVGGNPDALHRIAINLLQNAVRHTPEGTTVELSARSDGADAVLAVSDDGPGLPKGQEEAVFERFARGEGPADVSGQTGSGGSGLGLAIVRAVAEAHGGSVTARASSSGGACFEIRLPLADEPLADLQISSVGSRKDESGSLTDSGQPAGAALPRSRRASSSP